MTAWVMERALPLDSERDPRVASLLTEIAQKRVVFLGEPDHYVQEKYGMRLFFIRRLFEKGWRRIGLEMGRSDGAHVDAYLASGDEAELDKVGIYAPGGVRTPRKGLLEGLPPESKRAFIEAEKSFYRALRALSEARPASTPRLRFFGFDVDTDPLAASEQLAAHLAGAPPNTPQGRLASALSPPRLRATPPAALANELEGIATTLPSITPAWSSTTREDVLTLAASWRFAAVAFNDPAQDALISSYRQRETTMFRQLDEALLVKEPLLLMGHIMHLSKASDDVRFGRPPHSLPSWKTVGTHVAEREGNRAYSIWLLEDHGQHFDVACRTGPCDFASMPDTIEHLLAAIGPGFMLPLEGDLPHPFDEDVNWVQNGRYAGGSLCRQADLLYFVAQATAPRGW